MKRESSFQRRFLEIYDFECDLEKTPLCKNETCVCAVDLKRAMIYDCVEMYRRSHPKYFWVTIAHPYGICGEGRLKDVDLNIITGFYAGLIRKARIPGAKYIGHIDIAQQVYGDKGNRKTQWSLHVHLLLWADCDIKNVRKLFIKLLDDPDERIAHTRPVVKEPFAFGYMVKYVHEHKKKLLSSIRKRQWHDSFSIRGRHLQELRDFYSGCNIQKAFLLKGFRRHGIHIRPVTEKSAAERQVYQPHAGSLRIYLGLLGLALAVLTARNRPRNTQGVYTQLK